MKLATGYNHPFEVRKETCFVNGISTFSVLFLSDLHFNAFTTRMAAKISAAINELNPTIILFGGDYVDSKKGLLCLNDLLEKIAHRQYMYAIAGNHDYLFGLQKLEEVFTKNNVAWIEKKSVHLSIQNTIIKIDGNMINTEQSHAGFSILLLHVPKHINQFYNHYNLAFAGHLHGCQFVFWQRKNELYPGRLFYKCNILKAELDNCGYFISKGLGDTLPIRYNCKRDLIFVQVSPNH